MGARQWRLASVLAATGLIAVALSPAAAADPNDAVEFDSEQLEWCVRDALSIPSHTPVTIADMESLTSLSCVSVEASSMEDLAIAKNLRTLSLPLANAQDWSSLAALTALTSLDLDSASVGSLGWLGSATELTDLTMDWASATDLDVLVDLPVERLSIRSMGLESVDFLAEHPTLTELDFSNNEVEDISVLQTLPALEKVSFDANRVVDVTPLAQLPGLTAWSALNERGSLPPLEACVEHDELTGGTGIDGATYELRALGLPSNGSSFVVPFNGTVTLVTRNAGPNFSARFDVDTYGYESPCAWPGSYLPTVTFPEQLTVNKVASILAVWETQGATLSYRWSLPDGTVLWNEPSALPVELGGMVIPSVKVSADGMETVTYTGSELTIKAGHPADATFIFAEPPTVGGAPLLLPDRSWPSTTLTCEWLLDGVPVTTSASCEWVIPSSAAGKQLSALVTVHRANYYDKTYTVAPATVLRAFSKSAAGHVSGTVDVGQTLKVVAPSSTTWSPAPTSRTYQWLRNGAPIAGAMGSTYKLQTADAGKSISVEVTGHKTGYRSVTIETGAVKVRKVFTTKPAPTIAGTRVVGTKLTAKPGTWSPSATLTYQWYRNGKAVSGATKSTYTTKSTDGGAKFTVKVTAKKSGYTTAAKTSAAVTILKKLTRTPVPKISGTPKVMSKLTAKPGTWGPGTVTKTYQWYRNGKAIAGATKSTYTPRLNDAYAKFTVKVTGKRSGYASVTKTSVAVTASGIKYANCAALRKDYPGGVAKSSSTENLVRGVGVEGIRPDTFVSAALYKLNAARDADKDGWACE